MEKVQTFDSSEMGALAHLYRGEMYRSKVWRNRLDTTTNWAVGTTGLALSVTFSHPENSPLPLLVITVLITVFLGFEARRYRYFDMWRTRVRILERYFYAPILRRKGITFDDNWNEVLAGEYSKLEFHISFFEAFGRRLRRNYVWLFLILAISYAAKITIHPVNVMSLSEFVARASVGPISGKVVIWFGVLWNVTLCAVAIFSSGEQHAAGRVLKREAEDPVNSLDI